MAHFTAYLSTFIIAIPTFFLPIFNVKIGKSIFRKIRRENGQICFVIDISIELLFIVGAKYKSIKK